MTSEFESCDKTIKDPYERILKSYNRMIFPDGILSKYNLDIINKFYRNIPRNRMNYYKHHSRELKKTINTNKSYSEGKQASMDIIPASERDIHNYLSCCRMATFQIQAIMKLDGRLDFDRLKRAVRLSVDAEPVLASRFVEDEKHYWKRLDNIDGISFCSLEETDNADETIKQFLQSPLDMDNDPQVKVKIMRLEQYDILGVKLNYVCCDGTAAKEYIQLLSHIYSHIDQGNSTYIPESQTGSRKDQDGLFKELGIKYPELSWNPPRDTPKTKWGFPWIQRREDSIHFEVCRIPKGDFEKVYQYGKSTEATINDLILTAFYRTMFKISKPKQGAPMDITSTIDLRHYLPDHKSQVIKNLFGGLITRISRKMNETFDGTLSRVMSATTKVKELHSDVNNNMDEENNEKNNLAYFRDYFDHMSQTLETSTKSPSYIGNECFPGLCNLGSISRSLIGFGQNVVTDAYFIPPVIRAPGLLLLVSSYNDILTMSLGYCKASINQRDMKALLNSIKDELIKGCKVKTDSNNN
ncbi:condensation domain-containing protein [Clostridium sp. BNL1100]|uniref:condensation domain-containing protein n=1 Tax=Clostridium sp. BNL1100 TaxID=755731 RepID=UPI00024A748F|nr:condensation domain-containing protein [Clostridium sp. BNL1100]AEY65115.1 uncharacterized protein containing a NRPS condensation (elongation) domain [Clostridium sp. BNL1100]